MKRSALVVGATGLVGQDVLERLLHDPAYARVRVLSRRALARTHAHLDSIVTDFRNLDALGDKLAVDDVYCCLGSTLRQAGSRQAFAAIDEELVIDIARACRAAGAQQFIAVSAVGAGTHALSFYSRVKGRMERRVADLGFTAAHFVRPSLLLGKREDHRPAEAFAMRLTPLANAICHGPLLRYRPVPAREVAEAMVRLALRGQPGVHVHHLPLPDDAG